MATLTIIFWHKIRYDKDNKNNKVAIPEKKSFGRLNRRHDFTQGGMEYETEKNHSIVIDMYHGVFHGSMWQ